MKNRTNILTALICSLLAPAIAEAETPWYVEVGPVYRGDIELSVRGGTHAPAWGGTRRSGQSPSAVGSLLNDDGTTPILRTFDDGFVGPSGWPHAREDERTQYWGYQNADQYQADTDALSFQQTLTAQQSGTRTVTGLLEESAGWSSRTSMEGAGVMLTVGRYVQQEEDWSSSVQGRLGWLEGLRGNVRQQSAAYRTVDSRTYRETLNQFQTYRYEYDTFGNPAFPEAPYAMNDPDGVGPMIADTPDAIVLADEAMSASTERVGRTVWTEYSAVDLSFDARIFTFQVGPRIEWRAHERVMLLAQPSVTLNLLDAKARRSETLYSGHGSVQGQWSDHRNTERWCGGIGGQLGVRIHLADGWAMTVSGGYDWVDTTSFDIGPDRVRVDLSGYQGEIMLGRRF